MYIYIVTFVCLFFINRKSCYTSNASTLIHHEKRTCRPLQRYHRTELIVRVFLCDSATVALANPPSKNIPKPYKPSTISNTTCMDGCGEWWNINANGVYVCVYVWRCRRCHLFGVRAFWACEPIYLPEHTICYSYRVCPTTTVIWIDEENVSTKSYSST